MPMEGLPGLRDPMGQEVGFLDKEDIILLVGPRQEPAEEATPARHIDSQDGNRPRGSFPGVSFRCVVPRWWGDEVGRWPVHCLA